MKPKEFDKMYEKLQKKEYFRIRYPCSARPKIRINGAEGDIIDISEWNLRFNNTGGNIKAGTKVSGTIMFHDGQTLSSEGQISRIKNKEMTVNLSQKIPYDRIIKEQIFIIKNFANKIHF